MDVYEQLRRLSIVLPEPRRPTGLLVPCRQVGNILFVSGCGPTSDGVDGFIGKVGGERTLDEGKEAARLCVLNLLAHVEAFLGSLNRVAGVIKVLGFVASAPGFGDQPGVINAGSQILVELFGDSGLHARSAIGVSELPRNISVEIEAVLEVLP